MKSLKEGMQDGIPIALGYVSVSFTFGLMAVNVGMSWWQAVLISMTCITSAGQFAGLDIMVAGGAFIEMALSQFVINLRYALMALSLSQKVDKSLNTPWRFITGVGITDEIFAVAMSRKGKVDRRYLSGLNHCSLSWLGSWNSNGGVTWKCFAGCFVRCLGNCHLWNVFSNHYTESKENYRFLFVILIAAAMSCAFKWLPVLCKLSSGFVVIICAVVASAIGAWLYPVPSEEEMEAMEQEEQIG